MKTERDTVHDWERSAHCLQWVIVLAFSQIAGQMKGPAPVGLIARLLDVYISYTASPLSFVSDSGVRGNLDPTGGFRRARPAAIALRAVIEGWDGSPPPPSDVVVAAREMVTAYGHPEVGRWDEHTVPEDAWEQLLWPDEEVQTAASPRRSPPDC